MPKPGKRLEWIPVARMASGMDLRIAAHVLTGAGDGPTVGITAAIHGDELPPVEICRKVVETVDIAKLKGRLIVIPVCNPLAFETFTRNTPTDMLNMNRVFPGTADSWVSELIARALVKYLKPKLDVLLDLHAGGAVPTVDYMYVLNDLDLSRSFLFPTMYRPQSHMAYPGTLSSTLMAEGVKAVVGEIGGGGQFDDSYVQRGYDGVMNALRHLGAIPGKVQPPPKQILLTEMSILRPKHGGILHPEVRGDKLRGVVKGGTRLGYVTDAQTFEVLDEFHAVYEKTLMVLLRHTISKVHPGDYAYMLGNMETAEILK